MTENRTASQIIEDIQKLNVDDTFKDKLNEYINERDSLRQRKQTLNSLKTITILPDVWKIDFNCSSTPYLSSLNLFNGWPRNFAKKFCIQIFCAKN